MTVEGERRITGARGLAWVRAGTPWVLFCAIAVGGARHVLSWPLPWGTGGLVARALLVLSAVAALASVALVLGKEASRGWRARPSAPASLALAPLVLPPGWVSPMLLTVVVVAGAALGEGLVPRSRGRRVLAAVATHGLALAIGASLVHLSLGREGHVDFDPAAYAGIAKHVAASGRWEEPLVWHFQSLPAEVVHAPFDHWQPMTTLLLVPPLRVFGTSDRVTYVTMAVVSSASIVGLAHLVSWARPLRSVALMLGGVAAFGLSPLLLPFRLDAETAPVCHLIAVASLVAIAGGHLATGVVVAFGLVLTRLDAGPWVLVLTGAALWEARRAGTMRLVCVGAVAVACALSLLAYTRLVHGTFLPPGARASTLTDYGSLFAYRNGLPPVSHFHLPMRATERAVLESAKAGFAALVDQRMVVRQGLWVLAGTCLGMLSRHAVGRAAAVLVWVVAFVTPWASFQMYAGWRVPFVGEIAVVIGALYGVDAVVGRLASLRWVKPLAFAGATAAAAVVTEGQLVDSPPTFATHRVAERDFRRLEPWMAGEVVMTPLPFLGLSAVDTPFVVVPWNGERAMAQVIRRWGVTRVVLGIGQCGGESAAVCDAVVGGKRELPEGVRLEPMDVPEGCAGRVFRVVLGGVDERG